MVKELIGLLAVDWPLGFKLNENNFHKDVENVCRLKHSIYLFCMHYGSALISSN